MAGSVNKVILIGNLGRDPEVRSFQNGGRVCNLAVATSERWKDRDSGEQRERTEWHRVSIFADGLVTLAERYLSKGSKVYIEGKLETRKWQDQQGNDRYTTEVVLRPYQSALTFLDSAGGGGNSQPSPAGQQPQGGKQDYGASEGRQPGAPGGGGYGGMEDEIPFAPEVR